MLSPPWFCSFTQTVSILILKLLGEEKERGFFPPESQPTNMAYFTLGLVFTSRAGMLGSTAFYSGTMSQDSSWAVQAAAPASSQQCLQALADTGA